MKMKHLIVALIVLLAFVGTAAAADKVEIRSTILHFDTLGTGVTITPEEWAGFYYNLNTGVKSETLLVAQNTTKTAVDITYTTTRQTQAFDFAAWNAAPSTITSYWVLGFFAEPYVALNGSANKIAKLVIDSDSTYTMRTGASLELGSGYSLYVNQIDVNGDKVYLQFFYNGRELGDKILTSGDSWEFDVNLLNERNSLVMRVGVSQVFQGTETSLVQIKGLWLADYQNAFEVKSDVDYGKFEADAIGSTSLVYKAKDVALSADLSVDLGRGINLLTEKYFDDGTHATTCKDKFYFVKTYTEPGTYEVRSVVVPNLVNTNGYIAGTTQIYNFTNFAAFFYDIDSGLSTENMTLTVDTNGLVKKSPSGLNYTTTPGQIDFAFDGWTTKYYVMGLFGEKFVPLQNGTSIRSEKMAKLVFDDDTKYTLRTGSSLELGSGYEIKVNQIDVNGSKVYLQFFHNGKELSDKILDTSTTPAASNWSYEVTVLNERNTEVMKLSVAQVFQGTQDSLVEIKGIWLIDYQNATEVKSDDKYGLLKYDTKTGNTLNFVLDSEFTMNRDENRLIANNMYLRTADANTSIAGNDRFYFYVSYEIDGADGPSGPGVTQPPVDPETPPTTPPTTPETPETPPPTTPPTTPSEPDKEPSFWAKNMWFILGAVLLLLIIAGAAYYFLVMKKK
ncbi:MAG: hypothetical protein FWE54_01785 [Methanimicrococcus sp.]|nr:hypothetical protein [Methanimicrococcus sp.]